jgi:hypothetical protein
VHSLALATGWHTENFARTKRMKPLLDYIKPLTETERRNEGARKLLAMAKSKAKRKG